MASAVCAGVQRCSVTRCTTSSLPSGVSFALEWDMRASSSRLVSRNPNPNREALMSHSRAKLSPEGRLLVVQRVTEHRWTPAQTAEAMGVSRATVYKWLHRYREEGEAGLQDRSSRPHRSPRALPRQRVEEILSARRKLRLGPHILAPRLGLSRSTLYGVLRREGLSRLSDLDRTTREVIRYQKERPGELLHLDTKKLARIPDGGGHKMLGRSSATKRRGVGYEYLHVAVDERGATTAGSLSEPASTSPTQVSRSRPSSPTGLSATLHRIPGDLLLPRDPTPHHSPLPTPDQRQGRALHPHTLAGVCLRRALLDQRGTTPGSPRLAQVL